MTKRRMHGPAGAVFVPNVSEHTIALKVAAGEWTPFVESTPLAPAAPEPAPRARKKPPKEVEANAGIG